MPARSTAGPPRRGRERRRDHSGRRRVQDDRHRLDGRCERAASPVRIRPRWRVHLSRTTELHPGPRRAQELRRRRGRDNTDIDLFRGLGGAASTGTAQIDDGLQSGQYGLLLVIDGYNGMADDENVTVSYYVSNGVNRTADGGIPTPTFT